MITVDSTWDAANASLAKEPIVALQIAGYPRIFTTRLPDDAITTGVELTISGHSVPWRDTAYPFLGQATGSDPASIDVAPGQNVTIAYVSGLWGVSASGISIYGVWTANGDPSSPIPPGTGTTDLAGQKTGVTTYSAQLLGAWADSSGTLVAPPFPLGNLVTVTAPAGATKLLMGMNDGVQWGDNTGSITIAINGGSFCPWIKEDGISGIQFNCDPLNGSSELQDVTVTALDYQGGITADLPILTLEGRTAKILVWFPGVSFADAVVLFTGRVDTVNSSESSTAYDFVLKDAQIDLKKLVFLLGDDGHPTDSDHLKTFSGNPLDILFDILTSGLAISTGSIDVAKITAYRNSVFGGTIFKFVIDSPVEAKDFIENQIMKPLGGCLRMTGNGILTPFFLISLAGTLDPVQTLTADDIVDIPQVGQADLVNTISYKFDKEEGEYKSASVFKNPTSIAQYGQGTVTVESDGMRANNQAFFLSNVVSREVFNRFGSKNPAFDVEALFTAAKIEVSDIIAITHPLMPDRRAGVMGLTDAKLQVKSMQYDLNKFTVTLSLIDVSASSLYGSYRIAPDAQTDWDDSVNTTTDQKKRYMFITNNVGKYSDGVDGNPLG